MSSQLSSRRLGRHAGILGRLADWASSIPPPSPGRPPPAWRRECLTGLLRLPWLAPGGFWFLRPAAKTVWPGTGRTSIRSVHHGHVARTGEVVFVPCPVPYPPLPLPSPPLLRLALFHPSRALAHAPPLQVGGVRTGGCVWCRRRGSCPVSSHPG
ncbi:hypothetical protein B0T11DRAFT_79299 [Plectosphaerella cucumerina]|uniref:Uncharacterized protein n=1 Tax=Plectosphaerella cucumerina TaxID=40658 RepID=A0A8K0TKN6_9PEZI|nr:hypothetical protein B0T11DRAFT_79299 [Plectosphaerella cucumerina]